MMLSKAQMSDYKGAAMILTALPNANELFARTGYGADWLLISARQSAFRHPVKIQSQNPDLLQHR